MQLPHNPEDLRAWKSAGYAPERVITAWKKIIDAFAEAFPTQPLDIDVHRVLGADQVAQEVVAYGYDKLRERFGVFGGWLSGRPASADEYHSGMHTLVKNYGAKTFIDFQLVANETHQPERFAAGGLKTAIAQGMTWGARYFEIWGMDARNVKLQPYLRELALQLKNQGDCYRAERVW
jgi:hypothetical protein